MRADPMFLTLFEGDIDERRIYRKSDEGKEGKTGRFESADRERKVIFILVELSP